MTTEEKAKAYDEAIGRAKEMCTTISDRAISEYIFPELKENEDEKTKRILHSISSKMSFHLRDIFTEEEFQYFDAWSNALLEKQGRKPQGKSALEVVQKEKVDNANKVVVELKFKVGDVMRTLKEAANNITSGLPVVITIDKEYYHCTNELIAIKDQDDYEYPPINRIQKPTDEEMKILLQTEYEKGRADAIAEMQKSWSEEDTNMLGSVLSTLDICSYNPDIPADVREIHKKEKAWLSELYNRIVPQPKQEWNEEDERAIGIIKIALENPYDMEGKWDRKFTLDWLKSLKDRVQPQQEKERILGKLEEWLDEYISNLADVGTDTLIGSFRKYLDGKLPVKPKSQWKPSDRDIKLLRELSDGKICPDNYRTRLYEIINNLKFL